MRTSTSVLLLSAALLFTACDINSTDSQSSKIEVQPEPIEGGTVESAGNQLRAIPEKGYIFQYWKITYKDGTVASVTDDSVTVEGKTIENVKGVFGTTRLEAAAHLKAGPNGKYAYFVNEFIMPVDSATKKVMYAFVKADVHNFTKQKIYITEKRARFFDISHDGAFIAFSSYNDDNFDTYVLNIDEQRVENYGIGVRPLFANNSNKLLVAWEDGACIKQLYSARCRILNVHNGGPLFPNGFVAAAWSPDDSQLLLSRDSDQFYLFNTDTANRTEITTTAGNGFFEWLDNGIFLTSGANDGSPQAEVLEYSMGELNSPEKLPFTASFFLNSSPSKSRLVYIDQGINIFDRSTSQSKNILNYHEWDPHFPRWMSEDKILFYDRNEGIPAIVYTSGRVFKL